MFRKIVFVLVVCISTFAFMPDAQAQCSMCSANAEMSTRNGNTQGNGLNTGILYLLALNRIFRIGAI